MKRIFLKNGIAIALAVTGLTGCDIFQKDASPTDVQKVALNLPPNTSAVIDVSLVVPDFSGISVNETSTVRYLGDKYVSYKAGNNNVDAFTFNVDRKNGGKAIVNVSVGPQSTANDACDKNGAFTYARILKNSKLVVNLLNNYEFCGFVHAQNPYDATRCEAKDVWISIYSSNEFFSAVCTYTPPKDFVGQIKFKYYLGAGTKDMGSLVGKPGIGDPALYDFYSEHEAVIDVVEQ